MLTDRGHDGDETSEFDEKQWSHGTYWGTIKGTQLWEMNFTNSDVPCLLSSVIIYHHYCLHLMSFCVPISNPRGNTPRYKHKVGVLSVMALSLAARAVIIPLVQWMTVRYTRLAAEVRALSFPDYVGTDKGTIDITKGIYS